MLTNLIFATFTALLAHWAGDLSIELAVFVGWVTFRLETMATSFNLLVGAVQTQAVVENARLQTEQARVQLEQARYESAVAAVASNN